MKITHATLSHQGGRKINEDASGNRVIAAGQGCFVVADGLGGHGGGDVASKIAVEAMLAAYRNKPDFSAANMTEMLKIAQHAILLRQEDDYRLGGMRTTVVLLLLNNTKAWWAHVGDTRLYHFTKGRIIHQTRDHSVPQIMVDAGDIGYDDIRRHEDRNRLTRSLGNKGELRAEIPVQPVTVCKDDAFLICTDGFWEYVLETEMEATLAKAATPGDWLAQMEHILLRQAPERHDNYTATAIFVDRAIF